MGDTLTDPVYIGFAVTSHEAGVVDPWTGYDATVFTVTDEWAEYSLTTQEFMADVRPGCITFHVGFAAGVMWLDCIRFYEGDYVAPDLGQ